MATTVHNPIPLSGRRQPAWFVTSLALVTLLFLALPWSLEHKAHMLLHGLCAQRPSHTYLLGDRPLPFDARMTGIYLGYLATTLALFHAGSHRWAKPPTLSRIVFLLALGGVMVADGLNSLLKDLNLPYPYEPRNWLRVVTGMSAGVVLGVALCFLIASSLWRQVDTRRQTLESFRPVVIAAVFLVPAGLLVMSGWGPFYVPITIVLIASALAALTTLALVLIVIATRRDFTYRTRSDLDRIGAVALAAGIAVMLALSVGRSILESFSGSSTLT